MNLFLKGSKSKTIKKNILGEGGGGGLELGIFFDKGSK